MAILMTVRELMSFIEDADSKWVTLITLCSNYEAYSNWYMNFPYEMQEHDVSSIKIEDENHITLYIL